MYFCSGTFLYYSEGACRYDVTEYKTLRVIVTMFRKDIVIKINIILGTFDNVKASLNVFQKSTALDEIFKNSNEVITTINRAHYNLISP